MKKFHPAKPVSVYRSKDVFLLVKNNLNFSKIYDAQVKGLSAYLEITEIGELFVHVEPHNLPSAP